MKKLLVAILIILFYTHSANAQKTYAVKDIESSVETKCIEGYLFAIVIVWTGDGISIDMEQIFYDPTPDNIKAQPKPLKCTK